MLDFSRFDVLTFDCYGTLIDWERGLLEALRPVLRAHGVALDDADDRVLELFAELEAAAEQGPYRSYRAVLEEVMRGLGTRLGFRPGDHEVRALPESLPQWPPFADTVAALGQLAVRYQLCVISNVDDDLFAHSARQLGVQFAQVITAQQAGSYKPSLHNFRLALERIGAPRERVLHVAQSLYHDIAPARQMGLATVWVNRRQGKAGSGATPPAEARPDVEVPDLKTLAEMIESIER